MSEYNFISVDNDILYVLYNFQALKLYQYFKLYVKLI